MSDIVIAGATYPSVPSIVVPKSGGGTATYVEGDTGYSPSKTLFHVKTESGGTVYLKAPMSGSSQTIYMINSLSQHYHINATGGADIYHQAASDEYGQWEIYAKKNSLTSNTETVTIDSAKQYDVFLTFDIHVIRGGQLQSGYTLYPGNLRELSQQGTYVYANYSNAAGGNGSIGPLSNNDKQYLVMVASEATVAASSVYQGWGINDNTTSAYNNWFVASRFPAKLTNAPGMWYIDISNVNQSLSGKYVKIQLGSSAGAAHLNITDLYFTNELPT